MDLRPFILALLIGACAALAPAATSAAAGPPARLDRVVAGTSGLVPADPVTLEWPGWPYWGSCGELSFDPSAVFAEVPEAGLGRSALDRALRREVRDLAVNRSVHGWRLARRLPGRAGFVRGHPGAELESRHELEYMEMQRRRGRWGMESYSQKCWLWTMRRGRGADSWFLAPDQPPLGPDTQAIRVIAGARCTRTERPPTLAGEPRFDEFGGKLVMTLWLRYPPRRGGSVLVPCESGLPPWPPFEIELPQPLGDRALFNGGEYPPTPAAVYEEPTAIGL
jgi:hypothetical protein